MFCPLPYTFRVSSGKFLFLKIQRITRGRRIPRWSSWDSPHESVCTSGQIFLFFPVDLSIHVILPNYCTTITSSTFIGQPQFSWHFEINLGKFVQWCNSKIFLIGCSEIIEWSWRWFFTILAIIWSAFLRAVYHNI